MITTQYGFTCPRLVRVSIILTEFQVRKVEFDIVKYVRGNLIKRRDDTVIRTTILILRVRRIDRQIYAE